MGVLRNRLAGNYVQIPSAIFSSALSHGAVRVYCYLATKPDGWLVFNSDIKKQCHISDNNTIAKYLKQLVESGWVKRERELTETKQFNGGYDYELLENPNEGKTLVRENSSLGKTPKHSNTNLPTNIKKESNNNDSASLIINYLNESAGTRYKAVNGNIKLVNARMAEGYSEHDIKTVIKAKCADWIGTKFEQYLRPETLFGATKFSGYHGSAQNTVDAVEEDWTQPRQQQAINGEFTHEPF